MKRMKKISKIFLVLAMIFSQLSSVVTVLADEIMTKDLNLNLTYEKDLELGYVKKYELSYISLAGSYDEDKDYVVEVNTSFTYLDGETESKEMTPVTKTGEELNETKTKCELDPISYLYNGIFKVEVTVKDGNTVVFNDDITYTVDSVKSGLVGSLNDGEVDPTLETIGNVSTGEYTVLEKKTYTQNLIIMPGEISPNSSYRVMNGNTELYKGLGSGIPSLVINGTSTDTGTLMSGTYNTSDIITIYELGENEIVDKTITYTYNANINYYDSDYEFGDIFNLEFKNGYLFDKALDFEGSLGVSKISYFNDLANEYGLDIKLFNENGDELDLTNDKILASEIRKDYRLELAKDGVGTFVYTVVIMGDNTNDNKFDVEDVKATIDDYLDGNKVISMDVIKNNEDEEDGLISFYDIVYFNYLLNNYDEDYVRNVDLSLLFGDVPSEITVGDSFDLSVIVKSSDVNDFIDGISAVLDYDNSLLKLTGVTSNDKLYGNYKDNNLMYVGNKISNDEVVLTFTFMALAKGSTNVKLDGEISKMSDIGISEFDTLTKEINITRKASSNNNLSSLKTNVGKFDVSFDKDVTVYTVTVPYDTDSVILSGELEDINSTVEGLNEYTLDGDKTTACIKVMAEDGNIKVYTVYIVKEAKPVVTPVTYYYSSNNYLKLLEINGYDIVFDKDTLEYNIKVKSDVTSLDIKAIAEGSKASVEITGNEKFKKGNNIVLITVKAEDGSTREYKITVNKEEKKDVLTEVDSSSNTAEKVVIIILIILVVLGLLYLIFKKDDEKVVDVQLKNDIKPKKETEVNKKNNNNEKNNKKK